MTETTPMLDIKDLVVHYGGICALNQVSLHVDKGEIISVIGANGKIHADEIHRGDQIFHIRRYHI